MDKYVLDYNETSYFKGLKIYIDYLEEGMDFSVQKDIKDIAIWSRDNKRKQIVNFDFLKKNRHIEKLHVLVDLSKKSDINSLYCLNQLRELRWAVGNEFDLDFSKLSTLRELNIGYSNLYLNWDSLRYLHNLFIQKVKTEDLTFLSGLTNLDRLRINGGSIISLKGIERCINIEYIEIQACYKLVEVEKVLSELPKLKGISIESCKKIDLSEEFISEWGDKIFLL